MPEGDPNAVARLEEAEGRRPLGRVLAPQRLVRVRLRVRVRVRVA